MQKPHFPILVLVAAIAAVSLCGMRHGHCKRRQPVGGDGSSLCCPPQICGDAGAGAVVPRHDAIHESESSVLPPSYKIVPYHWVNDADDQKQPDLRRSSDKVVPLDWFKDGSSRGYGSLWGHSERRPTISLMPSRDELLWRSHNAEGGPLSPAGPRWFDLQEYMRGWFRSPEYMRGY